MKDVNVSDPHSFDLVKKSTVEKFKKLEESKIQETHPFEWLAWLTEEFGKLSISVNKSVYDDGPKIDVADNAVQLATVALKFADVYLEKNKKDLVNISILDKTIG